MAEEKSQVNGGTGEAELPTPTFSETSDGSPSADADAIVSKLQPLIESLVERKVQSTKDKRFSDIEKVLGGRLGLLAELEALGQEIPKEVRSEMRFRELEERLNQTPQPAPVRDDGSSRQKAAVTDAISELQKYGLDPNDASFIELLRGKYANRAEFDLSIQRHIVNRLAPPKPASPAGVTQAPATAAPRGEKTAEQLEEDYQKEAGAILQKKTGDERIRAIANLKQKYRGLGLDKV